MPALFLYLLQVNGALLLFYAGYWLVLRRLTFYALNRWYLLFAVGFSVAYPVVEVQSWLVGPVAAPPLLPAAWHAFTLPPATAASTPSYWQSLGVAYALGVGIMLVRLLGQLLALRRLHRGSWPAEWEGQPFRGVGAAINPFSFWQTIYLNPTQHTTPELLLILRHEQVHVRQWHTLDVLLLQLTQLLCWFNPGAWLLRRAAQENLEFAVDQIILRTKLLDAKSYQYSLLHLSTLTPGAVLGNHFTFLTLKNRIMMMNKKRSAPAYLGFYALLVPGLALLTLACSTPQVEPANAVQDSVVLVDQLAKESRSLRLPDNAVYFVDGKEVDKSVLAALNPTEIKSMEIFKDAPAVARFGVGAAQVIVVTTRANESSETVQTFRRQYGLDQPAQATVETAAGQSHISIHATKNDKLPADVLYVLDGTPATLDDIKQLDPKNIKSMNVLKGAEATAGYGEKGKQGVMLISTK